MIITQIITINGTDYIRTYSSENFYIERDGDVYEEAIDPINTNRIYTETDEHIPNTELDSASSDELQNSINILLGGRDDELDDIIVGGSR